MFKDIKVSVLMPAFNEELYVERAINSVLNQTYSNLEILVLNDNSSDKTGEIVKRLACSDKRIKYLEGNGKGVANARNILQAEARGQFLVNADADDFCKPTRIEKLLQLALRIGEPCLVGSNFDVYKNDQFIRVESFPVEHNEIKLRLKGLFNRYAISANQILGTAFLFKNQPVQEKFKIMSDWDQFLRIQENEDVKLGNVAESLYIYYLNSGSMTRKKFQRSIFSAFLRDCEYKRLRQKKEFRDLKEYMNLYWKTFPSFMRNNFFIITKYLQQFRDY